MWAQLLTTTGVAHLGNASARAGNLLHKSEVIKGEQVIFGPFDANMDYADFALHRVLESRISPSVQEEWLVVKDLETRGCWLLTCLRLAAGEALTRASADSAVHGPGTYQRVSLLVVGVSGTRRVE